MNDEDAPTVFLDTNILVYAFAPHDPVRSPIARTLIKKLTDEGSLRTSTQVLQECFVTLTRKVRKPLSSAEALDCIEQIAEWPLITNDYQVIREAIGLSVSLRLSFWDALIVAAASRARATRLYTEDLQHGQVILGVEIVNPFRDSGQ